MLGNARLLFGAAVAAFVACAPTRGAAPPAEEKLSIELVETSPVETSLRHPDLPQAKDVWMQMIQSSSSSIDFAEFYASSAPGTALERIVQAIESAADRGVRVRFLSEEKFYKTHPQTLDRLAARRGVQVRRYPTAQLSGGVMHAKYFIVDGGRAYIGSQNFDWRSLEHVQELGARVEIRAVVDALSDVFETDWALAEGALRDFRVRAHSARDRFPVTVPFRGEVWRITPVFSPKGWLPEEALWDLPRLVATIDGARQTARVQLLTYRALAREGPAFLELDDALRRASARGVRVQLLVSHWSTRGELIGELQRLQAPPRFTVKLLTIPPASVGFIPFARVVHAKYMVVDGEHSWLGTSNWERDYFERSRNVGLLIDSKRIGGQLDSFFLGNWDSPYAELVDRSKSYGEPRIGE